MLISNVVKALSVASGHGEAVIGCTNDRMHDVVMRMHRGTDSLGFVWLDCEGMTDAPKGFWMLVKERALAPECHVVFTNANVNKAGHVRAWQELSTMYAGALFGDVFVLTYNNRVKPQMVSSMKGLWS